MQRHTELALSRPCGVQIEKKIRNKIYTFPVTSDILRQYIQRLLKTHVVS